MDPLTAIGLAGSIIQFVSFSREFVSLGREIYRSSTGTREQSVEISAIIKDLSDIHESLRQSWSSNHTQRSKEQNNISSLVSQCEPIYKELHGILISLQVQGDHRKWKSFVRAAKSVWKEDQIKDLEGRLQRLQRQIDTHLIADIRSEQILTVTLLRDLADRSRRLEINRKEELKSLQEKTANAFKALHEFTYAKENPLFSNKANSAWNTKQTTLNLPDARDIVLDLSEQAHKAIAYGAERDVIQELSFTEMRYRQLEIKTAHSETLKWIYEPSDVRPSPTHFSTWLRNRDGIFWISGKPGSGKSTLMKYIVGNPKTESLLATWAGTATLITASFYFWSSGTTMQKSIEGFLRSLACQILRQCPSLISTTFPNQWHRLINGQPSGPIDREDITNAIQSFTAIDHKKTRFCFFIDGLDEYDGFDRDIAALMKNLALSPAVKICVASRPHNVFVNNFGESQDRIFYIHDFTDWDIRRYIESVFEGDPAFISCRAQDPKGYRQLAENIRRDANGVFLWVYLVVLQLLDGLQNADRMSDLQKKLGKLPKDLRSLFSHMLNTVEEDYHEQQAQMLLVACQTVTPLSLIGYSFIDEEDPDFALNCPIEDLSFQDVRRRYEYMQKRLVARCRLLLEPGTTPGTNSMQDHVKFLHRTVRDYLCENEAQKLLKSRLKTSFDANKMICAALLTQVKLLGIESLGIAYWTYWEVNGPVHQTVAHFMRQVKQYEYLNNQPLGIYVDQIERTVDQRRHPDPVKWWPSGAFLEFAIGYELQLYLNWKLDLISSKMMNPTLCTDLLSHCLSLSGSGTPLGGDVLNASIVKTFLDRGANPNKYAQHNRSPLQIFLRRLEARETINEDQEIFQTLEYLILGGADPLCSIKKGYSKVSIQEVIESKFSVKKACYLQDLLKEQNNLRARKARWYSLAWIWGT